MSVRTNLDLDNYYKDNDDISALFDYIVDPPVYPGRRKQDFGDTSTYWITFYGCVNDDGNIQKDMSIEDVYSYVEDVCELVNISPEIVIRFALSRFAEKMRQNKDAFASLVEDLLSRRACIFESCYSESDPHRTRKRMAILWRSLNDRQRVMFNELYAKGLDFSELKEEFDVFKCDL